MYQVQEMNLEWQQANVRCWVTCPVHTNAGGYVALIAQGRFAEAYELARRPNPLVAICGRICAHPCEDACRRGNIDEPVAICALKRFAVEQGRQGKLEYWSAPRQLNPERIAVVGSGPAGLAAAHDLALLGYKVTVFEAQPVLGGALRLGIPAYRLPRQVIAEEVEAIARMGVEFQIGMALGQQLTIQQLRQDFRAVFLALGVSASRDLRIPGVELDGVLKGVEFLLNVNLGYQVQLGKKVMVIGGGNVAIDVARSALRQGQVEQPLITAADVARQALRLGAREVYLSCLEAREQMPAFAHEVLEAEEEGIKLFPGYGPLEIKGTNGVVNGIRMQQVAALFDEQGRFNPCFVEDSFLELGIDSVILAIGQQAELSWLQPGDGLQVSPRGTIAVDLETLATSLPGFYAGGDVAFGPRIAVSAIADGRRAAASIHKYLQGERGHQARAGSLPRQVEPRGIDDSYLRIERQPVPTLELNKRVGLAAVELGLAQEAAQLEASRCLQCWHNPAVDTATCILCGGCVDVCPYNCLRLVPLQQLDQDQPCCQQLLQQAQTGQLAEITIMLKDEERCVRCGLCVRRCPVGAMSMVEYPLEGGAANEQIAG